MTIIFQMYILIIIYAKKSYLFFTIKQNTA